jgi:hypothetical protein
MTDLPINQIICGDCLAILPTLEERSVDLVFCSPPYGAARSYGINFRPSSYDWVTWSFLRFLECYRVCRGMVFWVIAGRTRGFEWDATPTLLLADLHRYGVKLRDPRIFHRVGIPGSGGPDDLRHDYEWIIAASHGELPWSDNTAMGHPPKWAPGGEMSYRLSDGTRRNQWGHAGTGEHAERRPDGSQGDATRPSHVFVTPKKWGEGGFLPETRNGDAVRRRKVQTRRKADGSRPGQHGHDGMKNQEQDYMEPVLANPGNVIKCVVGGGAMGSKLAHENEAPFPESLAEFFIRSFCPPNGVVLDPFCGSGTCCSVAAKWGRKYIGIDVRQSQVDLTNRRLEEQKGLFDEATT